MIFQLLEGTIKILACEDSKPCTYKHRCPWGAPFHLIFFDDRLKVVAEYTNICERHFIDAILDYLTGE